MWFLSQEHNKVACGCSEFASYRRRGSFSRPICTQEFSIFWQICGRENIVHISTQGHADIWAGGQTDMFCTGDKEYRPTNSRLIIDAIEEVVSAP